MAAFSGVTWICQGKWVTTQKIGSAVVEALLILVAAVQAKFDPISMCLWFFAIESMSPILLTVLLAFCKQIRSPFD